MKLNILIYIDTERPGFSYFREVIYSLKQGRIIVIYPEGRRSRVGKMIEPKIGFVKLAMITGTPIVPIGMKGTFDILPPHKKIPRFHKCEMFVGDPININKRSHSFKDIFLKEKNAKNLSDEGMKEIAIRIMDGIAKMVGQEWDDSVKKGQK
uniref:1-acyl-sn-glycerol-3-phosphate acyltransferase n=1 Tax=uncultured microorganism TaxID=358574 RepID=F8UHL8_9ZZZZ|nr:1-acyl-sn-glycerol-3-phosphate acyltransferase [uncultured microorganism]